MIYYAQYLFALKTRKGDGMSQKTIELWFRYIYHCSAGLMVMAVSLLVVPVLKLTSIITPIGLGLGAALLVGGCIRAYQVGQLETAHILAEIAAMQDRLPEGIDQGTLDSDYAVLIVVTMRARRVSRRIWRRLQPEIRKLIGRPDEESRAKFASIEAIAQCTPEEIGTKFVAAVNEIEMRRSQAQIDQEGRM